VDEGIRLGVTTTPAFFKYDQLIVGNSKKFSQKST
jgi:protein-disulfide isomerase